MTIRPVPRTTQQHYYLLAYDEQGVERGDGDDGALSGRIRAAVAAERPSDVFVFVHGWNGDLGDAERQYDAWTGMLLDRHDDINRLQAARGNLRHLLLGIHWPSKAWGDERFGAGFAEAAAATVESVAAGFDKSLGRTPEARAALRRVVAQATPGREPDRLSDELLADLRLLETTALAPAQGAGAAPGADRLSLDLEELYGQIADTPGSFGGGPGDGPMLGLLRVLSFWSMKELARRTGEGAAHGLLRDLQRWCDAQPGEPTRFHLMGHSFGCVVASAMVAGPPGGAGLDRPVSSLTLVQGALSCWAYTDSLPHAPDRPGYFRPILEHGLVAGPISAVYSRHDKAVGRFYPLGAFGGRYSDFASANRYSALGAFGAQGVAASEGLLLPASQDYSFTPGAAHNLNGEAVIKAQSGAAGAHNDIVHPEVGHLLWQAALASA
jgi:hypothetical protein